MTRSFRCSLLLDRMRGFVPSSLLPYLQALRVIIVVLLFLARPGFRTLGRSLVALTTALTVVSLRGTIRLSSAGIFKTLRVVVVLLLADERLLALGASSIVFSSALAIKCLSGTICGNLAIRL